MELFMVGRAGIIGGAVVAAARKKDGPMFSSSSAKVTTGRQFATITINDKPVEVELDADGKSMIVPVGGGRTVRIPRGGRYTVTGSAKGALTVVPSQPEPAEEAEVKQALSECPVSAIGEGA